MNKFDFNDIATDELKKVSNDENDYTKNNFFFLYFNNNNLYKKIIDTFNCKILNNHVGKKILTLFLSTGSGKTTLPISFVEKKYFKFVKKKEISEKIDLIDSESDTSVNTSNVNISLNNSNGSIVGPNFDDSVIDDLKEENNINELFEIKEETNENYYLINLTANGILNNFNNDHNLLIYSIYKYFSNINFNEENKIITQDNLNDNNGYEKKIRYIPDLNKTLGEKIKLIIFIDELQDAEKFNEDLKKCECQIAPFLEDLQINMSWLYMFAGITHDGYLQGLSSKNIEEENKLKLGIISEEEVEFSFNNLLILNKEQKKYLKNNIYYKLKGRPYFLGKFFEIISTHIRSKKKFESFEDGIKFSLNETLEKFSNKIDQAVKKKENELSENVFDNLVTLFTFPESLDCKLDGDKIIFKKKLCDYDKEEYKDFKVLQEIGILSFIDIKTCYNAEYFVIEMIRKHKFNSKKFENKFSSKYWKFIKSFLIVCQFDGNLKGKLFEFLFSMLVSDFSSQIYKYMTEILKKENLKIHPNVVKDFKVLENKEVSDAICDKKVGIFVTTQNKVDDSKSTIIDLIITVISTEDKDKNIYYICVQLTTIKNSTTLKNKFQKFDEKVDKLKNNLFKKFFFISINGENSEENFSDVIYLNPEEIRNSMSNDLDINITEVLDISKSSNNGLKVYESLKKNFSIKRGTKIKKI
jgi:hypothetical protein